MLYELLRWLEQMYEPPGFGAFEFISTRTAFASATALFISLLIGKSIIRWLSKMQLKVKISDWIIISQKALPQPWVESSFF